MFLGEKTETAFVALVSAMTSSVYATILLWDELSDRPRLSLIRSDVRISKYRGEESFRLDVGLRNDGRKDADLIRGRARIESLDGVNHVTVERLRWGRYMEPSPSLEQEKMLRSFDSTYLQLAWSDAINKGTAMKEPGTYKVTFEVMARGSSKELGKFLITLPQKTQEWKKYKFLWVGHIFARVRRKRLLFQEVSLISERSSEFLDQEVEMCARGYMKDC